jgi:hypothetical protein
MPAEFVPFLPGLRSRIASPLVAPGFTAVTTAPTPAPQREPRIEIQRSGDRITRIQVHCRCGDVIDIDCDY